MTYQLTNVFGGIHGLLMDFSETITSLQIMVQLRYAQVRCCPTRHWQDKLPAPVCVKLENTSAFRSPFTAIVLLTQQIHFEDVPFRNTQDHRSIERAWYTCNHQGYCKNDWPTHLGVVYEHGVNRLGMASTDRPLPVNPKCAIMNIA